MSVTALVAAGMTPANAELNGAALDHARAAWVSLAGPERLPRALFVPGRIEVLGKHTDYAGGATVTCAVERGLCIAWSARDDNEVRVVDARLGARAACPLDPDLEVPIGHWSNYPFTVARRVARNFTGPLRGVDLAMHSTLPPSAGLSSSSAIVTGTFLCLSEANALPERDEYRREIHDMVDLAGYLGSTENGSAFGGLVGDRGVGTFGGSEDHTAILCSEPRRLGYFAFCPGRRIGSLPMPAGHVFVIGASGVVAEKTGNARERYNRASALVGEIVRRWREATGRGDGTLREAVRSGPDAVERLRAIAAAAGAATADRLAHFLLENEELVPAAARALEAGDVAAFGAVSQRSQEAAERLLGNQVPETMALARLARDLGAPAASAFGAGFGGSTWALVSAADATRFAGAWRDAYRAHASRPVFERATFFVTNAGPAAAKLA